MKKITGLTFSLTLYLFVTSAFARTAIQIDTDNVACALGRISLDVSIVIRDEEFKFDPSCRFSFSERIRTKDNLACQISSGMCSNFSPKQRFEIECEDGSKAGVGIACMPR